MITLNTYYDKIYCINLDKREDKWYDCVEQFIKYNIRNVERFSAIDGKSLKKIINITPGHLGCIMSHLQILKNIIINNYEKTLILEDDVEFNPNINTLFNNYINQVPKEWDMLYLGGSHHNKNVKLTENVHKINKTYTTSSYSITLEMAKIMVEKLTKPNAEVDVMYASLQPKYKCFVFIPHLAWQRPSFSDILNQWVSYPHLKGPLS